MKPIHFAALVLLLLPARAAGPAAAAPVPLQAGLLENVVTVSARGEAVGGAAELRVLATIAMTADLAEEAEADFAQARTRAEAAFQDLALPGLEIEGGGVMLAYVAKPEGNDMNNMVFVPGMETPTYGATCSELLTVRFQPAEDPVQARRQVTAVLDTAVALGLELPSAQSPNPYLFLQGVTPPESEPAVAGVLGEAGLAALEEEAHAAAMRRAVRSARSLAQLSGRELGGVVRVTASALGQRWAGIGVGTRAEVGLEVTFHLR